MCNFPRQSVDLGAADSDDIVELDQRRVVLGQGVDGINHAIRHFGSKAFDKCW